MRKEKKDCNNAKWSGPIPAAPQVPAPQTRPVAPWRKARLPINERTSPTNPAPLIPPIPRPQPKTPPEAGMSLLRRVEKLEQENQELKQRLEGRGAAVQRTVPSVRGVGVACQTDGDERTGQPHGRNSTAYDRDSASHGCDSTFFGSDGSSHQPIVWVPIVAYVAVQGYASQQQAPARPTRRSEHTERTGGTAAEHAHAIQLCCRACRSCVRLVTPAKAEYAATIRQPP